jgi:uncharacterized protein
MSIIEIRKFKDMDLKGATIIEGFPSVGLVSTIVATYLIDYLKLDQICAVDSEEFPPTSMIYATKPKFPARIYANSEKKIGVFLAEFTPAPLLHRPIAKKFLEWCKEQQCSRIISTESRPSEKLFIQNTDNTKVNRIYGIGSTERTRKELHDAHIEQFNIGMIYGVGGVLLNEGRWDDFDVITLIIEAFPDIPDALAAAKILEAIDALIPHLEIETKPLYQESKKVEQQVKALRKQADISQTDAYKAMYH